MIMTKFSVITAIEDTNDLGEAQVSYVRTSVVCPEETPTKEIAQLAEEQGDWNILSFGEGTPADLDQYWVEAK